MSIMVQRYTRAIKTILAVTMRETWFIAYIITRTGLMTLRKLASIKLRSAERRGEGITTLDLHFSAVEQVVTKYM